MTAIVCVDEAWGMAFHGRRQSRDRRRVRTDDFEGLETG